MVVTYTQEIFKPRALKPVSLNPSIMEGEKLITSVLGPKSALRISRFLPTNVTLPSISGESRIPSTLTCFPGVWLASPQPAYTYQWYADGILLAGETNDTLLTDLSLLDKEITCLVTAENLLGSDEALSGNSIIAQLIEPINTLEYDAYVVSGLGSPSRIDTLSIGTYLITGIGIQNTQSIFSMDVYITTFSL